MDNERRSVEETLAMLREERAREARLRAKYDDLRNQRIERRRREQETADLLRKEQGDVDTLEGINPRAIWLRLTGDREERLSREKREAAAALFQHEQALRDLKDIEERMEALEREFTALRDCEGRYQKALEYKRVLLRAEGGVVGGRIADMEEDLGASRLRRKELGEAIAAGRRAHSALEQAGDSLDSAEGWGTWDIFGGGIISDLAKHGHIDDARGHIDEAQRALSHFRTELADVGNIDVPNIQIGEFATFADWFFDGLFADVFVQGRINDAQNNVAHAGNQVRLLLNWLEKTDGEERAECERLEKELTKITEEQV